LEKINPVERLAQTIELIDGAYAPATIKSYRRDFLQFIEYCQINGYVALPASKESVVGFIQHIKESKRRAGSIVRKVASLSCIHRLNEMPDPTKSIAVKLAIKRMCREVGRHQNQVEGVTRDILEEMLRVTDNSLRGIRDKAL